jgi:hypothetical protein
VHPARADADHSAALLQAVNQSCAQAVAQPTAGPPGQGIRQGLPGAESSSTERALGGVGALRLPISPPKLTALCCTGLPPAAQPASPPRPGRCQRLRSPGSCSSRWPSGGVHVCSLHLLHLLI